MKEKVALVVGASSGIGKSTALEFAQRGARVVVAARRNDELQAVVSEIQQNGGEASAIATDVSKSVEVQRMVDHAINEYGRLDFAVNNAAIEGNFNAIVDLPEEEWDRVLNINLRGVFLCLKYQAKAMLKCDNGGSIVNVGSVNSFLGFPTGSPYVTSKHALIGLTTSVSAELGPHGIRVNLVCPGVIDTPMHRRLRAIIGDDIYDKGFVPSVHLRRMGQPSEIAQTILYLCSDQASYVTGTTLTPDGGYTMTI